MFSDWFSFTQTQARQILFTVTPPHSAATALSVAVADHASAVPHMTTSHVAKSKMLLSGPQPGLHHCSYLLNASANCILAVDVVCFVCLAASCPFQVSGTTAAQVSLERIFSGLGLNLNTVSFGLILNAVSGVQLSCHVCVLPPTHMQSCLSLSPFLMANVMGILRQRGLAIQPQASPMCAVLLIIITQVCDTRSSSGSLVRLWPGSYGYIHMWPVTPPPVRLL